MATREIKSTTPIRGKARGKKGKKAIQGRMSREAHLSALGVLKAVEGTLSLPIEVRNEGWKSSIMRALGTITTYLRDERNPPLEWEIFPLTRDFYVGELGV